jgi:hypothetical protein
VAQLYTLAMGSVFFSSYGTQGYGGGILTRLHTRSSALYGSVWRVAADSREDVKVSKIAGHLMPRNFTITFIIFAAFCFVPIHRGYDNGPSFLPKFTLRNNARTVCNIVCRPTISAAYLNASNNNERGIKSATSYFSQDHQSLSRK